MTIIWRPTHPEQTQLWQFMRHEELKHHESFLNYTDFHTWSVQNPEFFWSDFCDFLNISWRTPPTSILTKGPHMLDTTWFDGATFNFAEILLSQHMNSDKQALICVDERNREITYTYQTLRDTVLRCAHALQTLGVQSGDRVAAVLPNTAYTIIAMLATTALGAIWASCSPDFGAEALSDRLSQIEPKILFICDGYTYQGKSFDLTSKITTLNDALPSVEKIIICPFLNQEPILSEPLISHCLKWENLLEYTPLSELQAFPFNHPLYILFSSGTTGKPKCIVHGAGGTLIQHLKELVLHTDLTPQDNLLFYTTCGWMMWNWMVSALAVGSTLTLYEGSLTYPTPTQLFKIIEQYHVTVLGCGAKFIAMLEKSNHHPKDQYNLTKLRSILSTGSPLLPAQYDYVYEHIKSDIQLSSISGGTDIISCFALGNPILPVIRGELQCLGLGMAVEIYDEQGRSVQEIRGELVCTQPFPSMPIAFWNDPEKKRYYQAYFDRFPNIWAHGDYAEITAHHGLIIYGRSDTILNPGGVRIGTAEIYRQLEAFSEIKDAVVIGQEWDDDTRIILFVSLDNAYCLDDGLIQRIKTHIRTHASPRHVPAKILQVQDIPRTLNGKIVETAVRDVVHGLPIRNKEAIANPEVLSEYMNRPELTN